MIVYSFSQRHTARPQMRIAAQVYDLVDKHIRELDEDLRTLQAEADDGARGLGLGDDETACGRLGIPLGLPDGVDGVGGAGASSSGVRSRGASGGGGGEGYAVSADADARNKRKYMRRKGSEPVDAAGAATLWADSRLR